jgi:hypothetical protein
MIPFLRMKTLHPNVTENSNVFALLFYLKLRNFNWLLKLAAVIDLPHYRRKTEVIGFGN